MGAQVFSDRQDMCAIIRSSGNINSYTQICQVSSLSVAASLAVETKTFFFTHDLKGPEKNIYIYMQWHSVTAGNCSYCSITAVNDVKYE